MVNLMRFHARSLDGDGSGWDAYLRYSALTVPMIKARGGTLLWTGDAKAVALGEPDGNQWDYLALVYYPSVAAFIDMMTSADYETRCDPHRRNGCAEHVIIATTEAYSKFKMGGWRNSRVVPANAGTHNPGRLLLRKVVCILPERDAAAYGPRRPPGDRGCSSPRVYLPAHHRRGVAHRLQLAEGDMARHVFHAAVGRGDQPVRGDIFQAVADTPGDNIGGFDFRVAEVEHAEHDLLRGQILEHAEIELWLRRLDRNLVGRGVGQFRQKRIAGRFRRARHHRGIAETQMHHGRHRDARAARG